jgi:CRP-like cAMP-binding protein
MSSKTSIVDLIQCHSFLTHFDRQYVAILAEHASNVMFQAGSYIFNEGDAAEHFYLIRSGRVALQTSSPQTEPKTFQTLQKCDFLGVSWLVSPYRWAFDALAVTDVEAVAFDATKLHEECESDHDFGYALMKLFVPAIIERLKQARLKEMDIYGGQV